MDLLFDTIAGLPVHPLIVHFAVVILPIAVAAVMVSIYLPRFSSKYAFASIVGLLVGTGAAFIANQSGEALAERIGNPQDHSDYGNILTWASFVFLALAIYWYRKVRQADGVKLFSHVLALLGVFMLGLTFLTGHSGAEAVWKGRLDSPAPTKTQTTEKQQGITLSEVAKHADASSCWSVIDSSVYDLTDWINKHPGGAQVIQAICGKDGTQSFNGQHANERRPAEFLASYRIGDLAR